MREAETEIKVNTWNDSYNNSLYSTHRFFLGGFDLNKKIIIIPFLLWFVSLFNLHEK